MYFLGFFSLIWENLTALYSLVLFVPLLFDFWWLSRDTISYGWCSSIGFCLFFGILRSLRELSEEKRAFLNGKEMLCSQSLVLGDANIKSALFTAFLSLLIPLIFLIYDKYSFILGLLCGSIYYASYKTSELKRFFYMLIVPMLGSWYMQFAIRYINIFVIIFLITLLPIYVHLSSVYEEEI